MVFQSWQLLRMPMAEMLYHQNLQIRLDGLNEKYSKRPCFYELGVKTNCIVRNPRGWNATLSTSFITFIPEDSANLDSEASLTRMVPEAHVSHRPGSSRLP